MDKKSIKVAIIAPLFIKVPPAKQGGTEWICYHQANGLAKRGYDVTLFAVKGSKTSAKCVEVIDKGTRFYKYDPEKMEASRKLRLEMIGLGLTYDKILERNFDIVFNHARGGGIILPFAKFLKTPILTITHLPIFKEFYQLYKKYNAPIISISLAQRKKYPALNYIGNTYNCVDEKIFKFNAKPKDYLLFIGTIGLHKNPLAAILACKKANAQLILAGKIRDQDYYQKKIKPFIDGKKIKYVGEIGLKEKIKYFQGAKALLFTSVWDEPFGLVMIEAMACGAPVIAFKNASAPEIIKNNKTGFLVPINNIEKMARAIKDINQINRQACRNRIEAMFTVEKMIDEYENIILKTLKIKN